MIWRDDHLLTHPQRPVPVADGMTERVEGPRRAVVAGTILAVLVLLSVLHPLRRA
jgi:hypothetical protein